MYKFNALFTGETYESTLSPEQLLKDVFRYTHNSWKLFYLGKNVFAVVNDWNIKFFRLWKTTSGTIFCSDVVVQFEVAYLIRKFIKGGEKA